MFVHANAFQPNQTNLEDGQLSVFIRLGSDYKSNFYEYEIPLKLTEPGKYGRYSAADARAVWPEENMLDIALSKLTGLKKERNKAKANGQASYNRLYSAYDPDQPKNRISVMGNPTLGEVKTMVIGVLHRARSICSSPTSAPSTCRANIARQASADWRKAWHSVLPTTTPTTP